MKRGTLNFRVAVAELIIKVGGLLQVLAIFVMRPDDLVDFGRRNYADRKAVERFNREDHLAVGLTNYEEELLEKIPLKNGRLVLLGVGGGREAVPLAKAGFQVTGVDFVEEMVHRAVENARRNGVDISGLTQDIANLELAGNSCDIVWFADTSYSFIPTRSRRVETLKKVYRALAPGGYVACLYRCYEKPVLSSRVQLMGKIVAFLSLGNRSYEKGDLLQNRVGFCHAFLSREEIISEFEEAGLKVVQMGTTVNDTIAWALLRKDA